MAIWKYTIPSSTTRKIRDFALKDKAKELRALRGDNEQTANRRQEARIIAVKDPLLRLPAHKTSVLISSINISK